MTRLPAYLRISVTDRCGLRCVYCRPAPGPAPLAAHSLTRRQVVNFVRAAAACGVRKVRLTGGEPLLHEDIVDIVRDLGTVVGIRSLGLTTNGQHLAPLARPLRRAGLGSVNISLPSLRREVYRRITGGSLGPTLAGVEAALREGYPQVKLNVVLLRGINDGEVEELARLARRHPVEVRFIECMPFCEIPGAPEPLVPAAEVLGRLRELGPISAERGDENASATRFSLDGYVGRVALISPMTQPFCSTCDRVRLTASGKLRACLVDGGEVDAGPVLENGCDASALRVLLEKTMRRKPARHHARFSGVMTCIGG